MKRKFRKILFGICKNIFAIFSYLCFCIYKYILLRPYLKCSISPLKLKRGYNRGKTVCIFANGPSLKNDLSRVLVADEFKGVDFSVMNYFANDPLYDVIKPKYYCFWDPQFFRKDERYEMVMSLFNVINQKTTWNMFIFINGSKKKFRKFSKITNPNIQIISIDIPTIDASSCIKHFFYRHGLAMPISHTVAIVNMWTAIQLGFENIRLYGADTSLLEGICVNENNQTCIASKHFYDKDKIEVKPITEMAAFRNMRLAEYIQMVLYIIQGHDEIADYAKSLGVKCLNCCRTSMLDCYPRKKNN